MKRFAAVAVSAGLALSFPAPAVAQSEARFVDAIEYARPAGEPLLLDAYLPAGDGPHPAVIFIHGGGWTGGSRRDLRPELAAEFTDRGMAIFSIDYRLAPDWTFPAPFADGQAAVRWIRGHAEEFDVDPARIATYGQSAGGLLAVLIGVAGEGPLDEDARVRATVSWSGPMDISLPVFQSKQAVRAFLGCADRECLEIAREASPVTHVDGSDAATLIANSTDELVPFVGNVTMAEALETAAIPHQLIEVPGNVHVGFYDTRVPPKNETVLEETLSFLETSLASDRGEHTDLDVRKLLPFVLSGVAVFAIAFGLVRTRLARRRRRY
ncbi:MAG: alpha/beta hydrolase fold domain-containing protein [Actinomycetota bacterium]